MCTRLVYILRSKYEDWKGEKKREEKPEELRHEG